MKSSLEVRPTPAPAFPNLYTNGRRDVVILMSSKFSGTVVHTDHASWTIGYHSTEWNFQELTPFHGTVTLSP